MESLRRIYSPMRSEEGSTNFMEKASKMSSVSAFFRATSHWVCVLWRKRSSS